LPYLPHTHIGIAEDGMPGINVRETGSLSVTRGSHSRTEGFTGFTDMICARLFIINSWNFDVNVNTIQQRTRNALLIFGNDSRRTPTGFCGSFSQPHGQGFIAAILWIYSIEYTKHFRR
jgi:hypothetical protein